MHYFILLVFSKAIIKGVSSFQWCYGNLLGNCQSFPTQMHGVSITKSPCRLKYSTLDSEKSGSIILYPDSNSSLWTVQWLLSRLQGPTLCHSDAIYLHNCFPTQSLTQTTSTQPVLGLLPPSLPSPMQLCVYTQWQYRYILDNRRRLDHHVCACLSELPRSMGQ